MPAGTFHQQGYSQHPMQIHSHGLHTAYVTSYTPYPTQAPFPGTALQGLAAGPGGQLYHTSSAPGPPHMRQVASNVQAMQVYPPSCQVTSHTLPTSAAAAVAHIHAMHSVDAGGNPVTNTVNSGDSNIIFIL